MAQLYRNGHFEASQGLDNGGGNAAVVLDDPQDQVLLEIVLEGDLAAGGVDHAGPEDSLRLVLEAQDAGMDDLDGERVLFPAIMDQDR